MKIRFKVLLTLKLKIPKPPLNQSEYEKIQIAPSIFSRFLVSFYLAWFFRDSLFDAIEPSTWEGDLYYLDD